MSRLTTFCRWSASVRAHGQSRRSIHMGRVVPEIDPELGASIDDQSVKPKRLYTRRNIGFTSLPPQLHAVAENRLRSRSDSAFRNEVEYLIEVMKKLKLPDDQHSLNLKRADIKTELEVRGKIKEAYTEPDGYQLHEETLLINDELSNIIQGKLNERRRDWRYFDYDERSSLLYMATRLAPNYACLRTVLKEISMMDPSFKPKSVLDFGSGMGTTIFAVNETWPNEVAEFMNIEISKEQQYLCEFLLRGGDHFGSQLPNVFHKQYLPVSNRVKYDMVVIAFSLLELPNSELRANIIENLWNKTNDLLVIVERGNEGGFTAVNDARNFVLDMTGHDVTKKLNLSPISKPVLKREVPQSHVLCPCPHEFICPRSMMTSKKRMNICRFQVSFEPLGYGKQKSGILKEEFSYVVLRKRPHENYLKNDCPIRWPRAVEKSRRAGKHVIQKLCCPNGGLAEVICTKAAYGKATYEMAKASDWGDIIPVKIKDVFEPRNSKLLKSH